MALGREAARKDYLAATEPPAYAGPFDAARAMVELRKVLPKDAVATLRPAPWRRRPSDPTSS